MKSKTWCLKQEQVIENIKALKAFMVAGPAQTGLYLGGQDVFLSEYVPRVENHRYYFTGFTGSVAEGFVAGGSAFRIYLFVDGRYYEQADRECQFADLEIVKVPFGTSLQSALIAKIKELSLSTILLEGDRSSVILADELGKFCQIKDLGPWSVLEKIQVQSHETDKAIYQIPLSMAGESVESKLSRLVKKDNQGRVTGHFISALDVVAWMSNCRGLHMPHQSQFMGKAIATPDKLFVVVKKGLRVLAKSEGTKLAPMADQALEFIYVEDWAEMETILTNLEKSQKIHQISFAPKTTNLRDVLLLKKVWGTRVLEGQTTITMAQAEKNPSELKTFRTEFDKSDRAIMKTRQWLIEKFKSGPGPSEYDYFLAANQHYDEVGALDQSFRTIAGFGPHSSIIHFGSPEVGFSLKVGELALLDSGGLYESGYATDTTRTFAPFGSPDARAREIYTLVLKGLLNALYAIFPEGTHGSQLDALARAPLRQKGYDYAHGTGHGVGINVHEGHFSITPISTVPLKVNLVGSLEPGIYIPGLGGVRLENIVIVKKHPNFSNMLCFESLTYVGFEENLIDFSQMTSTELAWLADYEKLCRDRGRSSMSEKAWANYLCQ